MGRFQISYATNCISELHMQHVGSGKAKVPQIDIPFNFHDHCVTKNGHINMQIKENASRRQDQSRIF